MVCLCNAVLYRTCVFISIVCLHVHGRECCVCACGCIQVWAWMFLNVCVCVCAHVYSFSFQEKLCFSLLWDEWETDRERERERERESDRERPTVRRLLCAGADPEIASAGKPRGRLGRLNSVHIDGHVQNESVRENANQGPFFTYRTRWGLLQSEFLFRAQHFTVSHVLSRERQGVTFGEYGRTPRSNNWRWKKRAIVGLPRFTRA